MCVFKALFIVLFIKALFTDGRNALFSGLWAFLGGRGSSTMPIPYLTENAKKIRKSLVICENMYNFAAVFQIYVNKEQCCNKE